ncbi:hypothetical protein Tco_1207095 [Tanacetum coccineum]
MQEPKKDQIKFDEEIAQRLQAQMKVELEEEERLAREREEDANIAEWDNIQAMIDADYELAARLQAQEHEELTIEEKSRLFVELMDKKKKHFAGLRSEEQRRKPLTKAQKRNQMCTYLKNMARFTHNQLKKKIFDEVQKDFDKTMSWIDLFVPMDSEVVKGSKDRAEGSKTRAEGSSKREQGRIFNKSLPRSKRWMMIKRKKNLNNALRLFQMMEMTTDGKTQMYLTFSKLLKNFDREDLGVLWRIVKARFKKIELVNYMDSFLHLNLKTIVHCVTMHTIPYYLLVEKMYPLTNHTLHQMFNDVKLQVDYESEMAYELLKLIKRLLSVVEVTAAGYDFYCCLIQAKQDLFYWDQHPIRYALTINPTIYTSCIEQLWATAKVKIVNKDVQLQALVDGKKIIITKASVRRDLQLNDEEGSGPKRQETMRDTIAQTRFENVSKTSNDSLLVGVNTPRSDEDRLKLNELMEFCTKLQQRVLDLENTKTAQAHEITSLKLRGRKINDIDNDAEITLVDETQERYGDEEMFDTGVLNGDEVLAEPEVTVKDVNLSVDEVTLAQALVALKSAKFPEKSNVVEEPIESITTTPTLTTTIVATIVTAASTRPKAKGLVIHEVEQATTPKVSSQQPS